MAWWLRDRSRLPEVMLIRGGLLPGICEHVLDMKVAGTWSGRARRCVPVVGRTKRLPDAISGNLFPKARPGWPGELFDSELCDHAADDVGNTLQHVKETDRRIRSRLQSLQTEVSDISRLGERAAKELDLLFQ